MKYFLDTVDTIPEGVGIGMYSPIHLIWIVICVLVVAVAAAKYRKEDPVKRRKMRHIVGALLVADEFFKVAMLIIGGNYMADYLPLHLCSINIIFIAIHCIKPTKLIDNFLFITCIPGAIAALLFPTWVSLPVANFMHWHSFTVHILLLMYPVMLVAGGDIRPDIRELPKCIGFLLLLAVPISFFNKAFDTNFMFLQKAPEGSPLYWFAINWGNHLLGYPILIAAVCVVMFGIYALVKKKI